MNFVTPLGALLLRTLLLRNVCSTLDVYMVNADKSVPSGEHFFLSVKEYTGALVMAGQGDDHAACSLGDDTFSELEQLLKQKTFTR